MVCEHVLAKEHPGTILLMTVSVFSLLTSSGILFLTHIQFVEARFADHEEDDLIRQQTDLKQTSLISFSFANSLGED